MDATLKTGIWQQYGAAIDMLDDAISSCPDHLWTARLWSEEEDERFGQYWLVATHCLIWLDLFLTGAEEGFIPPPPFSREELPTQPYSKEVVRSYLSACREKCQATIEGLTDEQAYRVCDFGWMAPTFIELQFYSMRHTQEHAAQLNLVLGLYGVIVSDWIIKARVKVA